MDLRDHHRFKIPSAEAVTFQQEASSLLQAENSDAVLRLALEGAGAGVWELDLVTNIVRLSPPGCRILGLPENHSGVLTQEEWLKTIDVRDINQILDEACTSAASRLHELRIRRPDGEIRWMRVSVRVVRDQEGRLAKLVGLQFDDTDRRHAEAAARRIEERFRLVQEAALIGTFVTDTDHRTIGSKQFYRNLGLPEDTGYIEPENLGDYVHPEDVERVEREMSAGFQATEGFDSQFRIIRADTGELRWIFARTKFEQVDDNQLIRMVGVHLDITESKRAEAALHESTMLNRRLLEASVDSVKLIDLDGRLLFMNEPGLAALEVEDASHLWGQNWVDLWPRAERAKAAAALQDARQGQIGRFDGGCPTAKGKPRWWDVVVTPICDEQGQVRQLLAISRDVSGHRDHLAQIHWTARHDMLTELPNRRYFRNRLTKVLGQASEQNRNVGLLQLDIDDFKLMNDALGHDAGDALLKEFARRLQAATRNDETVARLGGDEFAIIIPQLKPDRTLSGVVEDIRAQCAAPFVYQGRVFDTHASIGQAIFPQHGETIDDLLKSADIALYAAKTAGRGKVRRFEPSMRTEIQKRLDMMDRARVALRDNKIIPYYQPKINFTNGALAGFEALLRWEDSHGQVQLPAEIAAAFEDLDVAQAISEHMQLHVLKNMKRWLEAGLDFGHVAINASAAEFRQNDFAERLLDRIEAAGVPANLIELEVTETVFLGRGARHVERALSALSERGVRIALDDFGTGYASLSHLNQFPVDTIKIDQSFVRDLEDHPNNSAIIRALVSLGKSLSIGIVAEGIETAAQYAFLEEQGCDYGQGYLFSKAVPATEVPELLLMWTGSSPPHGFHRGDIASAQARPSL